MTVSIMQKYTAVIIYKIYKIVFFTSSKLCGIYCTGFDLGG